MFLSEAVVRYLAHRATCVAPNTRLADAAALNHLMRAVEHRNLEEVNPDDIDTFVLSMVGCNPSSRNLRVRKVRQFFDWCQGRGWVTSNPVDRRPEREIEPDPLFLSVESFPDLLAAAGNPRDRMVLALGLYLFLRSSEMQELRVADLGAGLTQIRTEQIKTGGLDYMPVCEELAEEFKTWLEWYVQHVPGLKPEHYLVPALRRVTVAPQAYPGTGRFKRVSGHWRVFPDRPVAKPHVVIQQAMARIGLPTHRQGGHTLRRSGARALFDQLRANQGIDGALQMVKSMLHHKDQAMTERYLGIHPEREHRDAVLAGQRMFTTAPGAGVVVDLASWKKPG